MTTKPLKSATEILEETIRFRAENVSHMTMHNIYPEAVVDILDEKDNKIKELEQEIVELKKQILDTLKQSIELYGGDLSGLTL